MASPSLRSLQLSTFTLAIFVTLLWTALSGKSWRSCAVWLLQHVCKISTLEEKKKRIAKHTNLHCMKSAAVWDQTLNRDSLNIQTFGLETWKILRESHKFGVPFSTQPADTGGNGQDVAPQQWGQDGGTHKAIAGFVYRAGLHHALVLYNTVNRDRNM